MAVISGWGRGTWSQAAWGEPLPVVVTGEAGTGATGTVSVIAEANVPATGLAASGAVGSVTVTGVANVVTLQVRQALGPLVRLQLLQMLMLALRVLRELVMLARLHFLVTLTFQPQALLLRVAWAALLFKRTLMLA